ncbi:hypothetical protein CK203_053954 [Vitis vinifera]|uniref:GAG-pre-integrase domain-containing protein n=1 Tax=Vitis vinifera TaxID=29760 RepID=A0A438H807_VITVI|nr:hypothetical protein CK203_053954 [Vitis vinifera]
MIVEINTNTNVKTTDFKEEDKVATTQLHINQGQQTSPMWSATDVIDGVCRIQDENLGLIAQVNMTTNRMFPLYLENTTQNCFSAKLMDEEWLWHFRYGHLNFGGLKTLQQKNMVTGLPPI